MSETDQSQGGAPIALSAPPYLRCIQWVPRRFTGGISPVTIVDLVFEQRVFGQVVEHVAALPETPVFGALIGHLFEDPTCERRWARVERAVRSPSTIPETADTSRLGQTLRATEMEWVPEEGEILLGWYRTHVEGGVYLSREEARFHEGSFPEPWSVALVLTGSGERRAGGVFQRTDPEGLSRSVYTPFYELVDPSSEFNGTTRRTFVGWANYQTEARVVRAGRGSVSADLPARTPGAHAEAEPDATGATAPAETPPGARERPTSPEPAPSRRERPAAGEGVDSEAEWERRQIQRSLMAVGRSLGPSELGALGAPGSPGDRGPGSDIQERTGHDDAPTGEGAGSGGRTGAGEAGSGRRPDTGNPSPPPAAPAPTVIPIHRDGEPPSGLVGRSRRRERLPIAKILAAAAGLTLVAAAGLVGTRTMMRDDGAAESPDAAVEDGSSMAGLSLSPEALRPRERGPRAEEENAPSFTAPDAGRDDPVPVTDTLPRPAPEGEGRGRDVAETGTADGTTTATEQAPGADPAAADGGRPSGGGGRATSGEGTAEAIVRPPSLEGLRVEDPVVAVYESALAIFRQEAERYETVRRQFDEGTETCNPLNLSYRGLRDAFERLERRLDDAGEHLPAPALRSFDSAERQFAMSRTHYTLTDCPMPVGG